MLHWDDMWAETKLLAKVQGRRPDAVSLANLGNLGCQTRHMFSAQQQAPQLSHHQAGSVYKVAASQSQGASAALHPRMQVCSLTLTWGATWYWRSTIDTELIAAAIALNCQHGSTFGA